MKDEIPASDYIVVGAGSAGCVVAARLTEDPATSVTLLEAGGADRNPWIHIPLGYGKTFSDPRYNWCYNTAGVDTLGGRKLYYPRGKVLGGSSSINGLIYVRGQSEDFDNWRQLGNVGWSYDDVLPFFRKAEDQEHGANDHHGVGGPLTVSDTLVEDPISDAFINGAVSLGYSRNWDFNGKAQDGVGYRQSTVRRGRRCSTAVAYLRPARNRSNLQVVTNALTTRILFDGKRAIGVEYRQGSETKRILARREVILSGGAVNSPQLLLLSGVGPADELADHGIDVVHNLPGVGKSLQDHYTAHIKVRSQKPVTLNDIVHSPVRKVIAGLQYLLTRKGPLSLAAGPMALYLRSQPHLASPDAQISLAPWSSDRIDQGLHRWPGFSLAVFQLRPESLGSITLNSNDAFDAPLISPNFLASATDRSVLVEAMKVARKVLSTAEMAEYVDSEYRPGESVKSDEDILAYVKENGSSSFHPSSSCRMGLDPQSVVDPALRVHGLENLRVIDASIMPRIVSANLNATTIMIGERGAALMQGR